MNNTLNANTFIKTEIERQEVYYLFSQLFSLPGEDAIDQRISLSKRLKELLTDAYRAFTLDQDFSVDKLMVDYAKLFIGPFGLLAPPYGSVYLDGNNQLMGESTIDALRRYHEAGIELSQDFKDTPDHITVELEFMHFMIFKELEALINNDTEGTKNWLAKQMAFLTSHLGSWLGEFSRKIIDNSDTTFYKELALAIAIFVNEDIAGLRRKHKAFNIGDESEGEQVESD